jgi:hypothetical protein
MAAELPRPGVEVIQVFRTVTPTVVSPTLVPCVVGVCKQIVDVLTTTAAGGSQLNASALIDLPGFFETTPAPGTPPVYAGLGTLHLILTDQTGGTTVDIEFLSDSMSPAAAAARINEVFAAQGVTEAVAEVSLDGTFFRVRTIGVGEFAAFMVSTSSDPTVLSAFGLIGGYVFSGISAYSQYLETIPLLSFPDPRNNLAELSIEPTSVRVFLGLGSGTNLRELSKTTSFLRHGGAGLPASVTGTVDITDGGFPSYPIASLVLSLALDGGTAVTQTITGVVGHEDLLSKINLAFGGAYASASGNFLKISSKLPGAASKLTVGGVGAATLGLSTAAVVGTAGVSVVDDGNGDSVSPLIDILGSNFTTVPGAASVTGVVTVVAGNVSNKSLTLAVKGERPQTLHFGTMASTAAIVAAIEAFWPGLTAAIGTTLSLTTVATGEDASIDILGGNACGPLGLVPSITGTVDLNLVLPDATAFNSKKVKFNLNGTFVEHSFSGLTAAIADIVTALNGDVAFSALAVAELVTGHLRIHLKDNTSGTAFIQPAAASSAEAAYMFGFDPGPAPTGVPAPVAYGHYRGTGELPLNGDDLYVDGHLVGRITAVTPGSVVNRLRINSQLPIKAAYGEFFYIVANKLFTPTAGRPLPELTVDSTGVPTIKPNVLRDTMGRPSPVKAPVYLAYHAVREDVTVKAKTPSLLTFDSTTQLESILSPINALNPLALGLYFALLNAPGAQVSGLGVDAIDASYPYGTIESFTRAAVGLEAYEVYAIAPLTHDPTVAEVFNTHVTAMSDPSAKGERICLFNLNRPTKKLDALVASGAAGNTIGGGGLTFDTGISNLAALALAKGISPIGTIPTSAGLFLTVASSLKAYSIAAISGGVVTLRDTFASGENDDNFYSTTSLALIPDHATLIDEPFNVKTRGATLVLPGSSLPDKDNMAVTYQAMAQGYSNRRFWNVVPDQVAAVIGGVEQVLEGFYLTAGIAGMIAQQPPQQSFTNFPMTGYTRVLGSNDFFTEKQLNIIAAGGNYIVVQDAANTPLIARMALTTDMTSLETRTDSITKIVDFTAKFMRMGLRAYIGRFNITQGFLDSLGHVCQGLLGFLTDIGVLIGANLNNVVQDASAPDTVLIDVTLDVPFPCNYIRLTLVI